MTTTNDPDIRPAAAFGRLALLSVAAAVAILAVGYFPTHRLAGTDGIVAMCLGVGIALLATLAGLVPPLLTFERQPRQRQSGILAGMAIRFILTLSLLIAALLSGLGDKVALAIWTAIGYMILLSVDVIGLVWLLKRTGRASS